MYTCTHICMYIYMCMHLYIYGGVVTCGLNRSLINRVQAARLNDLGGGVNARHCLHKASINLMETCHTKLGNSGCHNDDISIELAIYMCIYIAMWNVCKLGVASAGTTSTAGRTQEDDGPQRGKGMPNPQGKLTASRLDRALMLQAQHGT